eukprot:CAMPEP_0179111254 /NCGR_PEP_ID=MMETSP0796-20121207/51957_1 /TAXON_ID=73915 /ORGANISM="Pyrodinium bahamense, Strain pbaha01" /LENGTH=60 /DNA_ID=CAMNT_0020809403 /DNA_START=311 /DNA_END=493 /DNA_ORIENTATION=+
MASNTASPGKKPKANTNWSALWFPYEIRTSSPAMMSCKAISSAPSLEAMTPAFGVPLWLA